MRSSFSLFVALALSLSISNALPCTDSEYVAILSPPSGVAFFSAEVDGAHIVGQDAVLSPDDVMLDWKTDVINAHNDARAHHGAGKVDWSDDLYPETLQWASQCKFQHR
jgi:hypothetical protein